MKRVTALMLILLLIISSSFATVAFATKEAPALSMAENPVQGDPPVVKTVKTTEPDGGKIRLIVTVIDNGTGIAEVVVMDSGKKTVASKAPDEANADGTYSFRVNANEEYYVFVYDMDGETGTPDGCFVDKKAPVISNVVYDKETYSKDFVKVDFEVKDTGGIEKITVKSGAGDSITVKDDEAGAYSFEATKNDTYSITASDINGNVSEATKVVIDKIDLQAPVVKVTINKPEGVSKEPITFQYEVTDDIGIGSVAVDGKVVIELEKPRKSYTNEYTASKSGDVMIEVKDLAGNTAIETVNVGIIDTGAPVFTKALSVDDIAGVEAKASVAVEDDSELTYEWYILGGVSTDWGKLQENTPEVTITGLKRATTYTIKVVVTDEAGNSITDSRSFTTLNDNTTTEKKDNTMTYVIIAICVLMLIIGSVVLIIYLMFRNKNNDDSDDDNDSDIFDDEYEDDQNEYNDNGQYYDDRYNSNHYNNPYEENNQYNGNNHYNNGYYNEGYRDDANANIGSDLYRNAASRDDDGTRRYDPNSFKNRNNNNG